MLNEQQKKLLVGYRDKCYIMSILCSECSDHYSRINNFFKFPLIITNSIMVVSDAVSVRPLTPRPGGLRVFSLLRLGGPSAAPQTVQQKPSSAPAPARPADLRPHDSCSPRCPTPGKTLQTMPARLLATTSADAMHASECWLIPW